MEAAPAKKHRLLQTRQIQVPDEDLTRILDETTLNTLSPVSAVLVSVFSVFIIFNLLDLPKHAVVPVVVHDSIMVFCFGGLWLALRRARIPSRWSHALLAIAGMMAVSNILLTFYLVADPFYTTYVMLVTVSGGFFLLSVRWYALLASAIMGSWVLVALQVCTTKDLINYGASLCVASVVSFAVHTVRIRTYHRLERLRLINEQRKADLELTLTSSEHELVQRRQAEERYRLLVQGIEGIVWEADAESWCFTFVSDYAEEVLGYPRSSWLEPPVVGPDGPLPGPFLRRLHDADRARVAETCRAWRLGEHTSEVECRALRADGEQIWLRLNVGVVRGASGSPRQLRGLMVNITQRRRQEQQRQQLEAQLLQSQKMEAIGRLAGGVAHDMNNMLAAIMNLASVMHHDLEGGQPLNLNEDLADILKACDRGRSLTQNLLGFARRGKVSKERINLNTLVEEVTHLLERTIPKHIQVRQDLEQDLADIQGDPNQLQQALVNLCLNAAAAMEHEGSLTIVTEMLELDEQDLASAPDLMSGCYVGLRVADTGCGMDEETQRRAFEPFFTTKPKNEGTGLGLSMVYGTVRNHGGQITIQSAPGAGTTLLMRFPALMPKLHEQEAAADQLALPRGAGTILLVDDEELVRRGGLRMLEQLGYTVHLAEHGKAALRQYEQLGQQIELVILDLVMPEMDGRETFNRLRALNPDLRVLFVSGFVDDDRISELISSPGARFLQKPFNVRSMATTVAELLDADPH